MNKIKKYTQESSNSKLVLFAFLTTVIFGITAYKYIWGIELISRVLNITSVILFSIYAINSFNKYSFNQNVYKYYVLPGLLVYVSYFNNISISSINNVKVINQYGQLICWALYLAIPGFVKSGKFVISALLCNTWCVTHSCTKDINSFLNVLDFINYSYNVY